jgi:hypothetical protein
MPDLLSKIFDLFNYYDVPISAISNLVMMCKQKFRDIQNQDCSVSAKARKLVATIQQKTGQDYSEYFAWLLTTTG